MLIKYFIFNNEEIECVSNYSILGITINEFLQWKPHETILANKISKSVGILCKLKHMIPKNIRILIYNTLVSSHFNHGILIWGFQCNRLIKLQKQAIRHITLSKYNAHTEPLFKSLCLLKIEDIFKLAQLKFYHKYLNKNIPNYLQKLPFVTRESMHGLNTRFGNELYVYRPNHSFAKKFLRYSLPTLVNTTPRNVADKLHTHSFDSFVKYAKNVYIDNYNAVCHIDNCYICGRDL